ncbi:MAG: EMC3/TMCO1 family protein [Promethearchaeota archaeon]
MILTLLQSNPFLEWMKYPPGSMIFILLLAIVTALISTGLSKWLTDTNELQRKQIAQKGHDEEKAKIIDIAETDPEKYRKLRKRWERKDEMFKQSKQRMSLQRLKPSCITFVPMIVIFSVVRGIFENNPIALSPMNANDVPFIGQMLAAFTDGPYPWTELVYGFAKTISITHGWINFTGWYFLCSFGINTLIQRFFGLQTQATSQMGEMLGGSKTKALEFPDV